MNIEKKVKEESETNDKTIKVEDDTLKIKMRELQNKVTMLVSRMDMLLIKYSTTKIVAQNATNDVPILVKSEPKNNGSDISAVTLACSDNKQIAAHKVISLTPSPDFKIKKNEHSNQDILNVTLDLEDDEKIYVHSRIFSSSSYNLAVEYKVNTNMTLVYEDILQRNKLNTQGYFMKVMPLVFHSVSACQCAADEYLQQCAVDSPPSSCPPSHPQHQGTPRHQEGPGQHSRGEVHGECYYERGGQH